MSLFAKTIGSHYLSVCLYFAGDCLTGDHNINGQAFSTYDLDNDANNGDCAVYHHGAWWYNTVDVVGPI